MAVLDQALIRAFVGVTDDSNTNETPVVVYGTYNIQGTTPVVTIDGSDIRTPVIMGSVALPGDRVAVTIDKHQATVTSNLTLETSATGTLQSTALTNVYASLYADRLVADSAFISDLTAQVVTADTVTASILSASEAQIEDLQATIVTSDVIQAEVAQLGYITATEVAAAYATIATLETDYLTASDIQSTYATIATLTSDYATIATLETDYMTAADIQSTYATVETLESDYLTAADIQSTYATIDNLETNYLNTTQLQATYATINTLETDYMTAADIQSTYATISNLQTNYLTATDIQSTYATIATLTSDYATIATLQADYLTATDIQSIYATIDNLETNYLTATDIQSTYATISNLQANYLTANDIQSTYATIATLQADYLTASNIAANYMEVGFANMDTANIDKANIGILLNEVGLITSATISQGHVTGYLDAVEVNANKITAGTLVADRIAIRGSTSSIVYALNNDGTVTSQEVDTINGSAITERTITADHIVAHSITANELTTANISSPNGYINFSTGYINIGGHLVYDANGFYLDVADELDEKIDQVADGSISFYLTQEVDTTNATTTVTANVLRAGVDATEEFSSNYYRWFKKDDNSLEYLSYGYSVTVDNEDFDYSGSVICKFLPVVNGNPITITDASNTNCETLTATLSPTQASGTPTPSNPLEISGVSTLNVYHAGKNLCFMPTFSSAFGWAERPTNRTDIIALLNSLPSGTYTISATFELVSRNDTSDRSTYGILFSGVTRGAIRNAWGTLGVGGTATITTTVTISETTNCTNTYFYGCGIDGVGSTGTARVTEFQIEQGSSATPYETYQGTTLSISLGSTVYGGSVDLRSGVLTVDKVGIVFDGSEDWRFRGSGSASAYAMMVKVEHTPLVTDDSVTVMANYLTGVTPSATWGNYPAFVSTSNGTPDWLVMGINTITTVADWKTYLATNNLQVVYELATPLTTQLTPQTLRLLQGNNTLWTNAESLEVQYQPNNYDWISDQLS